MKILLFVVVVFTACSSNKTVVTTQEQPVSEQGKLVPASATADCDDMRSTLMTIVKERVPELTEIGAPYVKRVSDGKDEMAFMLRCPMSNAEDSLIRSYYEVGAGYVLPDGDIPVFWYRIFISKDMQNILIGELQTPAKPLNTVRASAKWNQDWQGRQ